VLGFYLLSMFSTRAALGHWFQTATGGTLAFSFTGLVLASIVVNLPFAVQPIQRAFENISPELREAAACSGLSPMQTLLAIELPLAWPGILSAAVLAFAHTLGEFGVVLMVGGNIPGETRTLSLAIYDRVQAFDDHGAGVMAAALLAIALGALAATHALGRRIGRRRA
jgi:molybdate transport system permease protein